MESRTEYFYFFNGKIPFLKKVPNVTGPLLFSYPANHFKETENLYGSFNYVGAGISISCFIFQYVYPHKDTMVKAATSAKKEDFLLVQKCFNDIPKCCSSPIYPAFRFLVHDKDYFVGFDIAYMENVKTLVNTICMESVNMEELRRIAQLTKAMYDGGVVQAGKGSFTDVAKLFKTSEFANALSKYMGQDYHVESQIFANSGFCEFSSIIDVCITKKQTGKSLIIQIDSEPMAMDEEVKKTDTGHYQSAILNVEYRKTEAQCLAGLLSMTAVSAVQSVPELLQNKKPLFHKLTSYCLRLNSKEGFLYTMDMEFSLGTTTITKCIYADPLSAFHYAIDLIN